MSRFSDGTYVYSPHYNKSGAPGALPLLSGALCQLVPQNLSLQGNWKLRRNAAQSPICRLLISRCGITVSQTVVALLTNVRISAVISGLAGRLRQQIWRLSGKQGENVWGIESIEFLLHGRVVDIAGYHLTGRVIGLSASLEASSII